MEKNTVIRNQKKFKNIITPEIRISLYQTAMNNSGRNFNGKKITAQKMAEFTSTIYKIAIKEIETIGELSIRQIEKTIKPEPTRKISKSKDIKNLMQKIKKGKK